MNCSFDLARALLLNNDWGRSAVANAMQDKDYIQNKFKFDPHEAKESISKLTKSRFECGVCYEELDETDTVRISECGHRACNDCVTDYCKAKVAMGAEVVYTRCVGCKFSMPEDVFKKTLSQDEYNIY